MALSEPTELELIDRAKAGDRLAFGRLVRLHQRRLYGCALQITANGAEADDAVQETFVRAWKALPRFDGRAALSTWLHRICVNVCLNARRRRAAMPVAELDDPRLPRIGGADAPAQPDAEAELRQLQRQLLDALDGLTESLRTTVVLVLLQGMPHGEAAQILGCSEGTVAWRIHEARRKLRDALLPFRPRAATAASDERDTAPDVPIGDPNRDATAETAHDLQIAAERRGA